MNLSKQEIGTIIIRVLGIYALMLAVGHVGVAIQFTTYGWDRHVYTYDAGILYFIATVLPLLVVGIWFLLSAEKLGSKLVGTSEQTQRAMAVSAIEWEEIALAVLGFYLLPSNLPRIVNVIYLIVTFDNFNRPFPVSELISATLMLVLSVWLILRAKGIVALVHRIRNAGATT